MPYEIRKQGSKFCVFGKDDGENKGCSDTRAMAIKHMRAMYANEKSLIGSKAWHPDASYLNEYISYLDTLIRSAQYSFMYTDEADDKHEELALFSERLIDFASESMDQLVSWRNQWYGTADSLKEASIAEKVVAGVKDLLGLTDREPQAMTLTKEASGRTRVLLRVSNMYKDRHGEIITEAAHKEYEAYVAESKEYPEFWLWHTPGSKWGQADLVSFDDGFLTMSGLVDEGKEPWIEALARQTKDLGVSHGFKYIKLGEDTIDWYRSFEASPLPREHAANTWTGMMLAKEWEMGLAERQKKFFQSVGVPDSVIQDWDTGSKDIAAELRKAGIEYKEVEPAPEPAPALAPAPKPDEQTTAAAAAAQPASQQDSEIKALLTDISNRLTGLETKQKELEERSKDSVASTMAAAIAPGAPAGFVASKQGEPPSDGQASDVRKMEEEGLVAFITGGGR